MDGSAVLSMLTSSMEVSKSNESTCQHSVEKIKFIYPSFSGREPSVMKEATFYLKDLAPREMNNLFNVPSLTKIQSSSFFDILNGALDCKQRRHPSRQNSESCGFLDDFGKITA